MLALAPFFSSVPSILCTYITHFTGLVKKWDFYCSSCRASDFRTSFPLSTSNRSTPLFLEIATLHSFPLTALPPPRLLTARPAPPLEGGACRSAAAGARLPIGCGAGPRPPAAMSLAAFSLARRRGDGHAEGGVWLTDRGGAW